MSLNYEIRVRGKVGEATVDALGLVAEVEPVDTVLHGPLRDQDELQHLLAQLQEMGLELLELRRIPAQQVQ
jgi:hypothetical protein